MQKLVNFLYQEVIIQWRKICLISIIQSIGIFILGRLRNGGWIANLSPTMDVIFSYYLRNTRNCLPTELLYWVWLGCSQLSSQQPISCSILDFWLKEYRRYTTVLAAAGHCLHSIIFLLFFSFFHLLSPASRIKRLRNCMRT